MLDFISKIASFIIGGWLERRKQKKILSEQFEVLKRGIIYETLMNNFSVHLADLRIFFLEHGLVEKQPFHTFFIRWLTHPVLTRHEPILGLFTGKQIEEMRTELLRLKL